MSKMPDLSVIIPVYNEETTLAEVINRVLSLPLDVEIIVVDDFSKDSTVTIAESFGPPVQVLKQETNQGKGAAIRRALPQATGRIIVIQDADLEYFPEDLPSLLQPFDDPDVKVVYGSRFKSGRPTMRFANYIANRILAFTANILYGGRLTDEATCYKLFRREVLQGMHLKCHRFEFCPEVTARVRRQGIKIHEVPIRYHPRTVEQGKKITWRDGFEALWTLIKYRFVL